MEWSNDGKGLAWSNMGMVQIAREKADKFVVEKTIPLTKVMS